MHLEIDLTRAHSTVSLKEPEDCKRLKVVVKGAVDQARLAAVLQGIGRPDGDGGVLLEPEAIERMAAGHVSPGWSDSFRRMLDYARLKGWWDEATGTVRAHCEWT
jgi:hypothetical protein